VTRARLTRRLAREDGIALVMSILIAALMLSVGLATLSFSDQQTTESGRERVKESSLQLAEGAMNAQANLLSASWPGNSAAPFSPCTEGSTTANCPDAGNLVRGFSGGEFGNGTAAQWSITVRDNGLGNYYDDTATAGQPAYDASGPSGVPDQTVWMRARATVRGQARTVVALVKNFPLATNFPRGVVTAGKFKTTNNGKKPMVDATGSPGIVVRCTTTATPARGNTCLDYVAAKGQVWPNLYRADSSVPPAMSSSDLTALKAQAQSAGTYYSTCPSAPPSGRIVYVESGPCTWTGNQVANSQTSPGMLILANGTISIGGGVTFYGILYAVNGGNLATDVITIGGNAQVVGAVVVDGPGGVAVGSSKLNITYDPNAFNVISTLGKAVIVSNSWRELPGH
jgi:hypothetical protein